VQARAFDVSGCLGKGMAMSIRTFWGSRWWRYDRWVWGIVFVLIATIQSTSGQDRRGVLLLLVLAAMSFFSAWRRSTVPLYTVTDDELLLGSRLMGRKRILWRDIKQVQQDGYGVRLIGHEWFGGTSLNLTSIPKAERDDFMQLVQNRVAQAGGEDE